MARGKTLKTFVPITFKNSASGQSCVHLYARILLTSFISVSIFSVWCYSTLLDGSNVRLNWNIESDMNVNWIKFKNFLSLY
jgi:hypothetical protein